MCGHRENVRWCALTISIHFFFQSYINPLFTARGISKGADLEEEKTISVKSTSIVVTVEPKVEEKVTVSETSRKGFMSRLFRRRRTQVTQTEKEVPL
jgi:hypothetical protein